MGFLQLFSQPPWGLPQSLQSVQMGAHPIRSKLEDAFGWWGNVVVRRPKWTRYPRIATVTHIGRAGRAARPRDEASAFCSVGPPLACHEQVCDPYIWGPIIRVAVCVCVYCARVYSTLRAAGPRVCVTHTHTRSQRLDLEPGGRCEVGKPGDVSPRSPSTRGEHDPYISCQR